MKPKLCPRCGGSGIVPDHRRKLSDRDVTTIRIRASRGEMQKRLAEEYGVTEGTISRLVRGPSVR